MQPPEVKLPVSGLVAILSDVSVKRVYILDMYVKKKENYTLMNNTTS